MSQETGVLFDLRELKAGIVAISLGENVLGGNEALNFSSKLIELNRNKVKNVIIDLQNVKMINSSGIGMLVSGLTTLRKNDANMILVGLTDKIKSIMKMTHLDQVFSSFENIEDALKNIG